MRIPIHSRNKHRGKYIYIINIYGLKGSPVTVSALDAGAERYYSSNFRVYMK